MGDEEWLKLSASEKFTTYKNFVLTHTWASQIDEDMVTLAFARGHFEGNPLPWVE